ncbi:hypothetical protein [Flavobacterium nitratireducens]|uniref:hypothetical protein n=1 Tax=Flavobacterium nitratireducens TaxID=992289 RepID=UPI002414E9A4|nr:hypothetical protein [Flavobacterium nitratireducens]
MNTKLKRLSVVVLLSFLGWYFVLKQSDYTITFKVNTATGTIFQGIAEWTSAQSKNQNEIYTVLEKRNFDFIKQSMVKDNEEFVYTWELKSLNDSVTSVTVGIKDLNHSIYNRLTVPFISTKFTEEQIEKIRNFKRGLVEHISNFKVKIDGETTSEEIFVAYISMESVLQEKAQKMIMNDIDIVGYLDRNKIKIIGFRPYLEIVDWNQEKELLKFNYCFPIPKNTKYIPDQHVKFKKIPAMRGIQATYFGNYRTSDRAWFAILDYAKRNKIKLQNRVLEHFLANPFNGGNELEWEAKIIIPFEDK